MRKKKGRRSTGRRRLRAWRAFEVVGLESEYAIVDEKFRPRCGVEALFKEIAGHATSDVELGQVGLSNELAAHVLELKTPPERSLVRAEARLAEGVRNVSRLLAQRFGWRLLPTGMHPLMTPAESGLWPRANRRVYGTYDRLFGIRDHGWLNVQSCQINLPFGSPEEAVRMHNAAACLVAYLPALAASTPLVEGKRGPGLCSRMAFYARNQARIPELTAEVIPEYVDSLHDYRRRVLGGIYSALDAVPGTRPIRHEWVNSRGAILRFDRRAMEVRVIDLQECPKMDVAIAVFVRAALQMLSVRIRSCGLALPDRAALVADHRGALKLGLDSEVSVRLIEKPRAPRTVRDLLCGLLEAAEQYVSQREQPYLGLVEARLCDGSLAERIRRRAEAVRAGSRRRKAILDIYRELMDCLDSNTPWAG